MNEQIDIWLVGNTGLRNPNRIQDGFKVFAGSPFVANLHGRDNEIVAWTEFEVDARLTNKIRCDRCQEIYRRNYQKELMRNRRKCTNCQQAFLEMDFIDFVLTLLL